MKGAISNIKIVINCHQLSSIVINCLVIYLICNESWSASTSVDHHQQVFNQNWISGSSVISFVVHKNFRWPFPFSIFSNCCGQKFVHIKELSWCKCCWHYHNCAILQDPDVVSNICDKCGGYGMYPCTVCEGSRRSFNNCYRNGYITLKCTQCDKGGLMLCDKCN